MICGAFLYKLAYSKQYRNVLLPINNRKETLKMEQAYAYMRYSSHNQDDGWKKIRRVKVRFEMIDRLDRALAPKVGRVSADSDGVADVVQTGQRILDMMANNEGKLAAGPVFREDPDNPYTGDSAWFIIQADDIDSLEKIYLQYQFRYSQNS